MSYLEGGIVIIKDTRSRREVRFVIDELHEVLNFAQAKHLEEEVAGLRAMRERNA